MRTWCSFINIEKASEAQLLAMIQSTPAGKYKGTLKIGGEFSKFVLWWFDLKLWAEAVTQPHVRLAHSGQMK